MKSSVRRLATFASLALIAPSTAYTAGAEGGWYTSYEEAVAAAKREGKPIFADFSTTWCHNCKQLDRETLSDPNISARLNSFIKVRVDGDQRPDVVQQFGVDAYPTLVTIDPAGRMLEKTVGFVKPRELAGTLDTQMQTIGPAMAQAKAAEASKKGGTAKAGKTDEVASLPPAPMASEPIAAPEQPRGRFAGLFGGKDKTPSRAAAMPEAPPARAELASANVQELPLSQAEERYKAQQGTRNVYASGAQPRDADVTPKSTEGLSKPVVAKAEAGTELTLKPTAAKAEVATEAAPKTTSGKASANSEIAPLISTSRGAAPTVVGTPAAAKEVVVAQAEPRKTPASAVAEAPAATSDEELPRPLVNTSKKASTAAATPAPAKETATKARAADKETATAAAEVTKSDSAAKPDAANPASSSVDTASVDAMSTIRKLQSKGSKSATTKSSATGSTAKAEGSTTANAAGASADATAKKPTLQVESRTAAKTEESADSKEKTAAAAETNEPTPAEAKPKGEEPAAGEATETAAKPAEVTVEDVTRWVKDADSKLVSGKKKEARAMYAKVYEKDPKNQFGKSDMAFIKMVSLMVDQDDDALRQKAFRKIKEFEALFPDSSHKDYYTLIRATLAADLGDTNAAHKLLETFPDRFPDSKYQKLAYETWKSLPPVTKETSKKQVASKESSSKKSTDKKKSDE